MPSSSIRHRIAAAIALALALVLGAAACGSSSGDGDKSSAQSGPRTLTIWLMTGSAPPAVVDAVNAEWKKAHPNDTVKVELQQWNNITTKLDAAFAGSSPPDVVELGNTLVSKYAARRPARRTARAHARRSRSPGPHPRRIRAAPRSAPSAAAWFRPRRGSEMGRSSPAL